MLTCPACGKQVPGEFSFCPFCGGGLTGANPSRAVEERKVISVLFCDLVGFTASSDEADPEDVRGRLRPYHDRVRTELERFGGTVEKFIGDAVMAVFGAPVVHEDDAERAVRASLQILQAIAELNAADPALSLQVRIGVNTGEAVIDLGARPELGQGIATGDVVNAASRLQGVAPVDGVAVSETTYRQTARVFDYESLGPVQVKGKAEPLAVWRPLRPLARFGTDITRSHSAPLAGRELERSLLIGTFERTAQQRSCALMTLVGEPGVGKSRLCAELFGYIEDRPGLVRWRQGHCLPYGDKISFWALGEIVKAECGILESDSADEAEAKLDRALPADQADRGWLKARLAPLVGVPAEPAGQEESFAAWRRFLESLAEDRETVLVFEDLHWADSAFLSFLEQLCEWAQGVRLLVLCTARPELYDQHPTFGANARNAQRIDLGPLSRQETSLLIASLLGRSVLATETHETLLEQSGGNPLYAEEFVRLLDDRGRLRESVTKLPDSVQALIAARLDALSPDRKSLLQDASVVGKVFWAGALVAMNGREGEDIRQALHELGRKELVRPARTSSMQDEQEYSFSHLLVRDVCYAQIPRTARAARHQAAARWLEQRAGERVEDVADVLAHHYVTALELARVAGQQVESPELHGGAVRYLSLAGDRAMALDPERAEASLRRALEFTPPGHGERAPVLERWAVALQQLGRYAEARTALEEASARYLELEDIRGAGRTKCALSTVLWALGDPGQHQATTEGLALLEDQPGPELVGAYAELAGSWFIDSSHDKTIEAADRAIRLAADLGLPEAGRALGFRGGARCFAGDRAGLADMRRALDLAIERSQSREAGVIYTNFSIATWVYEGPRAAIAVCTEGIDFCTGRGVVTPRFHLTYESLRCRAECGLTAEALAGVELLAEQAEASGYVPVAISARSLQAQLLARSRLAAPALIDIEQTAARATRTGVPWQILVGLSGALQLLVAQRRSAEARTLLWELGQLSAAKSAPNYAGHLPELVRCALTLEEVDVARRLAEGVEARTPAFEHALLASRAQLAEAAADTNQAAGLYAAAADRWREFGNVPERAYALLGQGRCLRDLDRPDADVVVTEASDLFAALGFQPALGQARALLGEGARRTAP